MTMTAEEFKTALERLKVTTDEGARAMEIDRTTAYRYASGRLPIPRKIGACEGSDWKLSSNVALCRGQSPDQEGDCL